MFSNFSNGKSSASEVTQQTTITKRKIRSNGHISYHWDDFGLKILVEEPASILEGKRLCSPNGERKSSSGESQICAFTVRYLCLPYVFTTVAFFGILTSGKTDALVKAYETFILR